MSIKIEGGKREQLGPGASELSISPGFIQEFMTQWVNTGKWVTIDTQMNVSPGDIIRSWLSLDSNLQDSPCHQPEWGIVEIRYIWSLASSPSYNESYGPERPLRVFY